MNRAHPSRIRSVLISAIGITILLGTPLLAQADQGKWWKPKEGDQRVERRDRGWRDSRGVRGRIGGGWGGGVTYRDRRYSGRGTFGGYSTWRGFPVRRDILVIRDRSYGGYFRARRVYCAPRYYGRFAYVRPVRFFIGADALIGGVGIHARIVRPHYLYGCNFCDARFDTYGSYAAHVEHCDHRPGGFRISVSNWDDGYDSNWDGPYPAGDDGYRSDDPDDYHDDYDHGYDNGRGYDNGYDDGGYDDP